MKKQSYCKADNHSFLSYKNDLSSLGIILRYKPREYQLSALNSLNEALNNKLVLNSLLVDLGNKKSPFMCFELATGSGKTALIGLSIYYLYLHKNIKNFLIITAKSSNVYEKTIKNFDKSNIKHCIWNDNNLFDYNLVTSENYTSIDINNSKPNIFIFNIEKFTAGNKTIRNIEKVWECSKYKDKQNNTISLQEYFKQNNIAVIVDEAHHTQQNASKVIIKNLLPYCVLEFTATARKEQNIIYKYSVQDFLSSKYGKLINIVPLEKTIDVEFQKIQFLLLTHLAKKHALNTFFHKHTIIKPIAFLKIKDEIQVAQNIYLEYLQSKSFQDEDNLKYILNKCKSNHISETMKLIDEMFCNIYKGDISLLQNEIKSLSNKVVFIHSKSSEIELLKWKHIDRNEIEIVVYINMLDEGIDMNNIYTIGIINDNQTNFLTSIKQIIGRGIRLYKDKRQFDNEENILLQQLEKLHIICDENSAFESVAKDISNNITIESVDKTIATNKIQKAEIPKLAYKINDYNIQDFFQYPFAMVIKFIKTNLICKNEKIFLEDDNIGYFKFKPTNQTMLIIYNRIIKENNIVPDMPFVANYFKEINAILTTIPLHYYSSKERAEFILIDKFCTFFKQELLVKIRTIIND